MLLKIPVSDMPKTHSEYRRMDRTKLRGATYHSETRENEQGYNLRISTINNLDQT
jgi:hypothetical protein